MGEPKGKLVTPVADNPDDELRSLEVDALDNLKVNVQVQADAVRHMKGYCPETEAWKYIRVNSIGEIVIDPITPDKINIETKARAYLSTIQLNIVHNTLTKVLLDTENYDVGSDFDHVTNHRFTAPKNGYYLITATIAYGSVVADKRYFLILYKNGDTEISRVGYHSSHVAAMYCNIADINYLEEGDYVELYALHVAGVNTVDIDSGTNYTFMSIHLLSV